MKQGDIYLGKPEGLAEFSDYPQRITLVEQITDPRYANRGDWIVEVAYTAKATSFISEIRQIWTEQQIRATFVVA
jgi:hypothetical protein